MPKIDKRVDAYIAKAPEFAKPILTRIREIVHEGCPDVEETIKWSTPNFQYNGMLCGMVAFKEYCAFHFWKGKLVVEQETEGVAGKQFGRLYEVSDLPPKKELIRYTKKAMALNDAGVKVERGSSAKPKLVSPKPFTDALKKSKQAADVFETFSASAKYEYVEWIVGAKTDATRDKRIAQAVEWISEGKKRNWKYQ